MNELARFAKPGKTAISVSKPRFRLKQSSNTAWEEARTPKAIFWALHGELASPSTAMGLKGPPIPFLKLNMLSASAGQSRRAFSILLFITHLSSPSDQGRKCSRTRAKCVGVRHQATVHPRLVVKVLPETYINTFFGRKNNTVVRSLRWICRQNGIVATARSEAARGKHAT